ncbi:hypothetical protein Ancab_026520 [Ancistrocladus abbreviatus]
MMDVGLVLPADLTTSDPSEDICHQVYLVGIVSKSIGRGTAKAKAEEEMKVQLEAKNFEIARLYDRLHYYDAMNREISQRNQEAMGYCNHFWLIVDGLTMLGGACRAELVEINPDETCGQSDGDAQISRASKNSEAVSLWGALRRVGPPLVAFSSSTFCVKTSGEYFRQFSGVLISPLFVFLVGNAIVVTLIAKSGHFSRTANNAVENELYESVRSEGSDEVPEQKRPCLKTKRSYAKSIPLRRCRCFPSEA